MESNNYQAVSFQICGSLRRQLELHFIRDCICCIYWIYLCESLALRFAPTQIELTQIDLNGKETHLGRERYQSKG